MKIAETLKLSQPAHRALANASISTLKQLAKHSEKEVAALHGMGPKALLELKKALKDNGLSFTKKK